MTIKGDDAPGKASTGPLSHEAKADAVTSFNLYFAAGTISSNLALANLRMICQQYDLGSCRINEINILHEPLRALSDGILITPTLVRLAPLPRVTIVGDLSDTRAVLLALGLDLRSQRR